MKYSNKFQEKPIDLSLKANILIRFIEFHSKSNIFRFILNYLFATGLAQKIFHDFRHILGSIDINSDGIIFYSELRTHFYQLLSSYKISEEQFKVIFQKIDIGKDGFIGYTEFCAANSEKNILEDPNI